MLGSREVLMTVELAPVSLFVVLSDWPGEKGS
jgi:hypothetical protein